MAASEGDDIPMIPAAYIRPHDDSRRRIFSTDALDSSAYEHNLVDITGHLINDRRASRCITKGALRQETTGGNVEGASIDGSKSDEWPLEDYADKYEHLLKSGKLGTCNDPYCTICPVFDNVKECKKPSRTSETFDAQSHNMLHGDTKSLAKRILSILLCFIPGVMNPHSKVVQRWNKFFVISCSFAGFLDPLFFFLLYVHQQNKCIVMNWPMTKAIVILRSMTDCIYMLHILLQIIVLLISPGYVYGSNYTTNVLRVAILAQNTPRLYRLLVLVTGSSPDGRAEFVINLFAFLLVSHLVGSFWYLIGLERISHCVELVCHKSNITSCLEFMNCGHGNDHYARFCNDPTWELWKKNEGATACFEKDGFEFGIYQSAVNLTTHTAIVTRYVHSLYWGFQELSTLAGNQVPSYFVWEVVFTMVVRGVGLVLFAMLVGSMQNFFQSFGHRRWEMSSRRYEVEQWMNHHCLPEDLQRQVRDSEHLNWVSTKGVNEDILMESLPKDLQLEIKLHLFKCIKKVRIFWRLNETVIDAICERLKTGKYMKGRKVLYHNGLVDKMVFIIRGKMVSVFPCLKGMFVEKNFLLGALNILLRIKDGSLLNKC